MSKQRNFSKRNFWEER